VSAPPEPQTRPPAAAAEHAAAAGHGPSRPATGYAIVLPPGWRGIPVRQGTAEAIRRILDEVFGRLGKGRSRDALVRHRIDLRRKLTAMADRARENSGSDLYLPIEYVHGVTVPASFVVSEGPASAAPGDPAEVVAYLLSGTDGATEVVIDGAIGVRTEHAAAPEPDAEVPFASRRVDYALAMPGRPGQWLMAVFSTLGNGDPDGEYARILVELFDAMMSTFRWTWE